MMNFEPRMNANTREWFSTNVILSASEGSPCSYINGRFFAALRMTAFVAALLLTAIPPARAETPSPQTLLMVANVAGECDILYSMVEFQKKSHINGGEEYVAKFWADQSAKLGLTVDQL